MVGRQAAPGEITVDPGHRRRSEDQDGGRIFSLVSEASWTFHVSSPRGDLAAAAWIFSALFLPNGTPEKKAATFGSSCPFNFFLLQMNFSSPSPEDPQRQVKKIHPAAAGGTPCNTDDGKISFVGSARLKANL